MMLRWLSFRREMVAAELEPVGKEVSEATGFTCRQQRKHEGHMYTAGLCWERRHPLSEFGLVYKSSQGTWLHFALVWNISPSIVVQGSSVQIAVPAFAWITAAQGSALLMLMDACIVQFERTSAVSHCFCYLRWHEQGVTTR